jgi:hypothetical protein
LWKKSRAGHLKFHLDAAAWMLPGEINAMKNCAPSYEGLATMSGKVDV